MIDEGETDWKVLAIDITDPLAENLNDIHDVEKVMPGFLAATVEWFKVGGNFLGGAGERSIYKAILFYNRKTCLHGTLELFSTFGYSASLSMPINCYLYLYKPEFHLVILNLTAKY